MKTISGPMSSHLAGDTTIAVLCKLKRFDGTIIGFSDHDQDITIDISDGDGSITYEASHAFTRGALKGSGNDLQVQNTEVSGFLDAAGLTEADLRAGKWDFSEYKFFAVNWKDPSMGIIRLSAGKFGAITIRESEFVVELLSLSNRYSQTIVRPITAVCRHIFGDSTCRFNLRPAVWQAATAYTATVVRDQSIGDVVKPSSFNDRYFKCITAGTSGGVEPTWDTTIGNPTNDNTVVWEAIQAAEIEVDVNTVIDSLNFTVNYSGTASDNLLTNGLVTFTSGNNVGVRPKEITAWSLGSTQVTLFENFPLTISPGDTLTITAGCEKTRADCKLRDNIKNFGGFPDLPGVDFLFNVPLPPQ